MNCDSSAETACLQFAERKSDDFGDSRSGVSWLARSQLECCNWFQIPHVENGGKRAAPELRRIKKAHSANGMSFLFSGTSNEVLWAGWSRIVVVLAFDNGDCRTSGNDCTTDEDQSAVSTEASLSTNSALTAVNE